MSDLTEYYQNLLIKQYWEKPNAYAEAGVIADGYDDVYNLLTDVIEGFDLDQAVGNQLDVIGRIVGVPRIVPLVLPKIAFGFDETPNGRSFDDKFLGPLAGSAPFLSKFEQPYTSLQLDDSAFRFFIRAKIASNTGSAYMVSDDRLSVQDVINTAFDGFAYAVDRQDMSLALYVSPVYELDRVRAAQQLGLLPNPQGVRYEIIVQASPGETFGFTDNPSALSFANKFDRATEPGGRFALKVIL